MVATNPHARLVDAVRGIAVRQLLRQAAADAVGS